MGFFRIFQSGWSCTWNVIKHTAMEEGSTMHDVLAIAATILVGSHTIVQSKVKKAVHHMSANAAMILVSSHTLVQSDIRTSFYK